MSGVFHYTDGTPSREGALTAYATHRDDVTGLRQAVHHYRSGRSGPRAPGAGRLEALYVLSGTGTLHRRDGGHPLRPESAALLVGAEPCEISTDGELVLVSVSADERPEVACGPPHAVLDLADRSTQDAVSDREYQVLFDPATGCSGVTQFLGHIPAVRTPRHYHPYSEMAFVVGGSGRVEIEGAVSALGPGSCFHLPAGVPHRVENTGSGFLRLLGVFTPAGSPAQHTPVA
ncbi:cupin domain-containing protein [Saccharothrix australiensis]|uniref:Cupin type-2 domain-containing protein n=1 Tax=Saccharothrix australiensis TaxID=2072 RepID=A0A495W344_9PSEU|nr:cupin domain-containing protein [Saccharothrix australiensis]RKT56082.1 hypothetical protein C8E97_4771 [Saccharothrix australiensis]